MKGIIKVLVGIVIVVVALILIVGGALKLYFSEEKIIALVKPEIEKATKRKIQIQGAEFSLLKGFVIKGLSIKEVDGKRDFASLKEFSISYELWPLLEKKIKINSVSIIDPKINIIRYKDGTFNYETLIPKGVPGEKAPSKEKTPVPTGEKVAIPLAITLNNVSISNAHVMFTDEMGELPDSEAQIDLNTNLNISPGGAINYAGKMAIFAKASLGRLPSKIESKIQFNTSMIRFKGDVWLDEWLVKLDGSVKGYTKRPEIALDISSKKLDLDAILLKIEPFLNKSRASTQMGSVQGSSVSRVSEGHTPPPIIIPPIAKTIEATGRAKIEELIYSNLPINNVEVNYQLKDGRLTVEKKIGDLSGGKLHSNIEVQLKDDALPFKGDLTIDKVELSGLMHLFAPKLVGVVSGDISTQFTFYGNALPQDALKKSLVLKGTYGLQGGKIMRNPITIAISRLLNMKELEEPSFRSVDGNIDLEKGWVVFKSIYSSKDINALVERGRVSLDGKLDVPLVIKLSKELSQKLVARKGVLKVLINEQGIAELPITLKGTYNQPIPTLNMKKAKDQLIKGVIKGFFGK